MRELATLTNPVSVAESTLEREFVDIFSDLADLFGYPRSYGAIYGLLFSSQRALPMEEIIRRLEISKGSASQGLRQLEELGAISRARENGLRTRTYIARIELKPLLAGFLQKRLAPRLSSGTSRLQRLKTVLPALPPTLRPTIRLRLDKVTKWHKRANAFLPLAQKLLQGE
jgi:DNA-binding transcriptional regulator GbsR (MarR family)